MLQVRENGKVVATVLPQSHNPAVAGPAELVIDNGKTGSTVREIRLPDIGVVLYYAPHTPKHGTATEEREVAQMIPIAAIVPAR
jgi:ATP phosphoribosyltransferase